MFKHEQLITEVFDEEFGDGEDIVTVDTEIMVMDVHEEERVDQVENIDMKDKFDTALPNRAEVWYQDNMLKCNICDFASARKSEISDHKTTIHSWCYICFSSYTSQEHLMNHFRRAHSKKIGCLELILGAAPR